MSVSLDGFAAHPDHTLDWLRERLVRRVPAHRPSGRALGEELPLMHGIPEPQRLEMVSSTVYADGSVAQVLRPF